MGGAWVTTATLPDLKILAFLFATYLPKGNKKNLFASFFVDLKSMMGFGGGSFRTEGWDSKDTVLYIICTTY